MKLLLLLLWLLLRRRLDLRGPGLLGIVEQRLVADELVAVLLEDVAGEGLPTDHEDGLAEFPELVHEGDEVAVAADNGEGVDMVVGERHFERVQRQVDVGSIFVAAR
jgi:hypothetical protein